MIFNTLVKTFDSISSTRSRNLITDLLVSLYQDTPQTDIKNITYLLFGRLGPMYQQLDLGMADKLLVRALSLCSSQDVSTITQVYKKCGDLGDAAQELLLSNPDKPTLTVNEVYEKLFTIATSGGSGSQDQKINLAENLISQATPMEVKYLIKIMLGKLRLNLADKTILDAFSFLIGGSKSHRSVLDRLYQTAPDLGELAFQVIVNGIKSAVKTIKPKVGVPIMPALAQRLKTANEMIDKMGKVIVEPKYDGVRTQIHFSRANDLLKSYSRSLDDTTSQFPELKSLAQSISAESVIIDSEAVGFNKNTGKPISFQETITRKRKYDIELIAANIPLRFHCFDLMFLNGESQIEKPLDEGRRILASIIKPNPTFILSPSITTDDPNQVRNFHQQQLNAGLEGAMVKQLNGTYEPGRTGFNWVKFKEAEESAAKLPDTLDLIVMGYYVGKGKRTSFGVGAFLVGTLNPDTNQILSVCKIGTGLTDDQWRELHSRLQHLVIKQIPPEYQIEKTLLPDFFTIPSLIVEIAADEITTSTNHTANLSLRFPRLIRFRDDKNSTTSTSINELKLMANMSI